MGLDPFLRLHDLVSVSSIDQKWIEWLGRGNAKRTLALLLAVAENVFSEGVCPKF